MKYYLQTMLPIAIGTKSGATRARPFIVHFYNLFLIALITIPGPYNYSKRVLPSLLPSPYSVLSVFLYQFHSTSNSLDKLQQTPYLENSSILLAIFCEHIICLDQKSFNSPANTYPCFIASNLYWSNCHFYLF